jgi:NlpC/P60 family/Lysozyme like domain
MTALNPDTWRYELSAGTSDGRRLSMPFGALTWSESTETLAAELKCTIPNLPFSLEDGELVRPWDALGAGTPVFLSVVPRGGTGTARATVAHSALLGAPWDPGLVGVPELGAGLEVFRGTVLDVKASTANPLALEIMARDALHVLLLHDVDLHIQEGTTFRQAFAWLAEEWGMDVGRVDGPDVELGEAVWQSQPVGEVLAELLDMAIVAGAGEFLLRASGGHLDVIQPGSNQPVYEVRSGAGAGASSVSVNIADLVEEVEVFAEDQPPPDENAEDQAPPQTGTKGTSGKVLPLRRISGAHSDAGFSGAKKRVKIGGISQYRGQTAWDRPAAGGSGSSAGGASPGAGGSARNGSQVSDADRYAIAMAGGFNAQDAVTIAAISLLECPNCEFSSVNSSGDMGLFQVNKQHWANYGGQAALVDPVNSARAAYGIYNERQNRGLNGWLAWCVYPGGCNGASPTTPAQFAQLEARIRSAIGGGSGAAAVGGRNTQMSDGALFEAGPSQERADLEAAVALGEDGFPKWRWEHVTVDLPQVRKYDMLSVRDSLIDGRMLVVGVAHQPSTGTMRLVLEDEETFARKADTVRMARQLAKLRGEEDAYRKLMQEQAAGGARAGTGRGGDRLRSIVAPVLGRPYERGGRLGRSHWEPTPAPGISSDCSGFTAWVFYLACGEKIPAFTGSIRGHPTLQKVGSSLTDAVPGDVILWAVVDANDPITGHVGIYLGSGECAESGGAHGGIGIGVNNMPVWGVMRSAAMQRALGGGSTGGIQL